MDFCGARKMVSDLELEEATLLPPSLTKDELLQWLENEELETACGQCLLPPDDVENAIRKCIIHLENCGYEPDDAQLAVFDALAYLVDKDIIPDAPLMEASDSEKSKWISQFDEKIYDRLKAVGIEFEDSTNEQEHSEDGNSMAEGL